LPGSGNTQGDAYLVQTDDSLHVWDGATWVSGGSIQGPQGIQGESGEQGIQGEQGIEGPVGPQGLQGPAGEKGNTGDTGPAGADGAVGPAGADGAVGPQGPQGETGDTGPAGPAGADGADGASDWSNITNTPTTLAGYGITDGGTGEGGVTSYNDLTDKPTIPVDVADLTDNGLLLLHNDTIVLSDISVTSDAPSGTTSTLVYDDSTGVFTFTSAAESSGGGVTSYNDLTDKPTIPVDVADLTDNGLLLLHNDTIVLSDISVTSEAPSGTTSTLVYDDSTGVFTFTSAAESSGGVTSYNDLTDKPTIPVDVADLTDNGLLLLHNDTIVLSDISVTSEAPSGTTSTLVYDDSTGVFTFTSAAEPSAGEKGDTGDTGPEGPAGPAGPAGADGADGADSTVPGPQGETGPAGPVGPAGPAGADGVDGADSTVPGPQGEIGPAGADGADGADSTVPGPQGETGPAGPVGPAGADGADGAVGPVGPTGAQGPIGADGPPGDVGAQGPAGPAGADGADSTVPGPKGDTGDTGPTGPAGADSTVPGPQGEIGPDGPAGPVGPAGADGADGADGAVGPAGPQGLKGDTGDTGPVGPAGATTMTGLTDTLLSNVQQYNFLQWNGSAWINDYASIRHLEDVDSAGLLSDDSVMVWNSINNQFEFKQHQTITSLSINANILKYTDEDGVETNIDLSTYLDDTNLARISGGTLDANTGVATFTRDDDSTFTLDLSDLLNITLSDISVGTPATASGNGDLSYNNTTGVFTYTPPVIPSDISDLTDTTSVIPTDLSDLTDTTSVIPTDLSDLTDNDSTLTGTITSSDLDMGGNRVLFANVYNNEIDLPSASTYHGMFAHVHGTGKGYYAHAGSWIPLATESQIAGITFNDINSKPTTIAGYGITDAVEDFADLGTTPTTLAGYGITDIVPTELSDLTDVSISTPSDGQIMLWNASNNRFEVGEIGSAITTFEKTMYEVATNKSLVQNANVTGDAAANSGGTIIFDTSINGNLFHYHNDQMNSPSWTADITNLQITNYQFTNVTLIIRQKPWGNTGTAASLPTVYKLDGQTFPVQWADEVAPTATINGYDVIQLTIMPIETTDGTGVPIYNSKSILGTHTSHPHQT